jgi:hypothetical protein
MVDVSHVAFEIQAIAHADGDWEIVSVECEPTADVASKEPRVSELDPGSWEFRFTLPADFDDRDPVFHWLARYGLDPETVYRACCGATGTS